MIPTTAPNVLSVEEANDLVAAYHGNTDAIERAAGVIWTLSDWATKEGDA